MRRNVFLSIILLSCLNVFSQKVGDESWQFDASKYDANYPVSKEFAKAGREGGIPQLETTKTVCGGENIQAAINSISRGVIELEAGNYRVTSQVKIPSNIVIRGAKNGKSIIEVEMRAEQKRKTQAFRFLNAQNSGLENIEFRFIAPDGVTPIDKEKVTDGGWCGSCFSNNPSGVNNLHVGYIHIDKNSKNCWVDNCRLIAAGTDPIFCEGDHNTFRNNYVDRSYNKGGNGAGYYNIYGDYNLVTGDTVRRIRHFAIQHGAKYNVVYKAYFEVDINFHNGDGGYNLVEKCKMRVANWHGWDIFIAGVKGVHRPPGANNMFFDNSAIYRWYGHRYDDPNKIYTFSGYSVVVNDEWEVPAFRTFYPMKTVTTSLTDNIEKEDLVVYPNPASNQLYISGVRGKSVDVKIYTENGALVKTCTAQDNLPIDISSILKGKYYVNISSKTDSKTFPIIKK